MLGFWHSLERLDYDAEALSDEVKFYFMQETLFNLAYFFSGQLALAIVIDS